MNKLRAATVASLFVVVAVAGGIAGDTKTMAGNDVFPTASKDFRFLKLNGIRNHQRVIVPMVELKVQNWASQTVVAQSRYRPGQSGTTTAQAHADVTVAIEAATVQRLATAVHQDLVRRLEEQGWSVVTLDSIRDSKAYASLGLEGESKLGMTGVKATKNTGRVLGVGIGDTAGSGYFIATAEGTDFIKPKMGLTYNAVRGISKEADAVVLIPSYTINVMSFDMGKAESRSGFGDLARRAVTANVGVIPVLELDDASFEFTTPKGMLANIIAPRALGSEPIGEVVLASESSPGLANAIGAVGSALGMGGSSRKSGAYVLAPDTGALEQQILRITGGVNDVVARAAGFYAPKAP
ncbi:MAG TPA: hypothetical protein VF701_22385 [Thermoanaerobaculia bacterium]